MKGLIFVISGPSGSGKSTLLVNLLKDPNLKHRLVKSISLTTRPRRQVEQNGRDYVFVNAKQFQKARKAKKILEWTRYLGYYYATPKGFIKKQLKKSKHILLCLDLKGAAKIKQLYTKNTITIFVLPPSLEALRDRIKKRCHKTQEGEIQKRLKLASKEAKAFRRYDYCLVNKTLRQAVRELKGIILKEIAS